MMKLMNSFDVGEETQVVGRLMWIAVSGGVGSIWNRERVLESCNC